MDELRTFILGDSELESRQLALWPFYSFDIIPIQLISSIYELFFHLSDEDDEKGTYYTPLHLVDMVMDEVYPWEGKYEEISFLEKTLTTLIQGNVSFKSGRKNLNSYSSVGKCANFAQ